MSETFPKSIDDAARAGDTNALVLEVYKSLRRDRDEHRNETAALERRIERLERAADMAPLVQADMKLSLDAMRCVLDGLASTLHTQSEMIEAQSQKLEQQSVKLESQRQAAGEIDKRIASARRRTRIIERSAFALVLVAIQALATWAFQPHTSQQPTETHQ